MPLVIDSDQDADQLSAVPKRKCLIGTDQLVGTDQLKEKCAVFGIIGPKSNNQTGLEAARLTFYGLWALQHRGQESSGIASSDGRDLYRHAAAGLVATVYREEDLEQLPGHIAIGHNRYSTSGGTDDCYNQPFLDRERKFSFAHNGNLPDTSALEAFLTEHDISLDNKKSDSAMMSAAIGCYIDQGADLAVAIKQAYPLFTGVFSAVAMSADTLVAFRDPCGIRPLSIATIDDGGYAVASETCAFDTVGAKFLRDVKPGELVAINEAGLTSHQIVAGEQKLDIFEMIYFARPDSLLLGKRVDIVRQELGRTLAKEFPIEADVIIPVPDSSIPAALGYSQASGIPFEMALIKNRYIHRTFIRPTAQLRERDLKMKLNPVIELIKDQRVVLVDDSIVRGTTMRHLVPMMFEAGAREVHLLISCPPVRYPDFYGINTPKQSELSSAYMTDAEMRDYVGATSLHFLSFEGMIKATGLPVSNFTTSCFTGEYPISIGERASEISQLGDDETLPTADHQPTLLATARIT
jgi:amidophosphoribosyltransferase